eukprot:scaffold313499_cov26-Prasinocladus_malaysianus.AAC.1
MEACPPSVTYQPADLPTSARVLWSCVMPYRNGSNLNCSRQIGNCAVMTATMRGSRLAWNSY